MPTTTGKATDFITFSRASLATVTDSDGKIKWAGHNLLTNSESFDASAWTKGGGATVAANAIAAPNGTITADRLKEATATDTFSAYQNITVAGATVTFSVFARSAERTAIYLRFYNNPNVWEVAVFDLSAGTNPQNASGASTTFTGRTQSITPVGSSGWYLCSITAVFPSTAVFCNVHISDKSSGISFTTDGNSPYAGNAANGVYVWGAHAYRSDLGSMVLNPARGDAYYPTTPRNLLGFTEDFSNAYWNKLNILAFGSGSVSNAVVAPNGLQTADLIIPDTTSGTHVVYASITSAGNSQTHSIYVKPNGYTKVALREDQATGASVAFLLSGAGSVLATNTLGGLTPTNPAITALSDGWYRISTTFAGVTPQRFALYILPDSYTSGSVTGSWTPNGTSGIYLWGAQASDSASLDAYSPAYSFATTSIAYYAPRLDYSGSSLAALGLLVEEQRTNLLLRSAEFDLIWTPAGLTTVTANAAVSPDGTSNADKLIEDTSTGLHRVNQSFTGTAVAYTFSVYVKAAERNQVRLILFDGTSIVSSAYFDVSTNTVVSGTGAITFAGNGWYRCSITGTLAASASCQAQVRMAVSGAESYTGDGTSGIFVWGAQVELGSFPTSLIPTGASTATRSADVASVATSAFPYSASEGTVVASGTFIAPAQTGVSTMVSINNGTSNESISIYRQNSIIQLNVADNGGPSQAGWSVTPAPPNLTKAALAYKENDFGAAVNGTSQTSDTSGTLPTVDRMEIGRLWSGAFGANGWIRQITYIPRRLSNAELQARTL